MGELVSNPKAVAEAIDELNSKIVSKSASASVNNVSSIDSTNLSSGELTFDNEILNARIENQSNIIVLTSWYNNRAVFRFFDNDLAKAFVTGTLLVRFR